MKKIYEDLKEAEDLIAKSLGRILQLKVCEKLKNRHLYVGKVGGCIQMCIFITKN